MSHVDFLVPKRHLNAGREFQEAKVVGDGGTVLAHFFAELVLGEVVSFDKVLIGEGHFYRVEVLALDVLDECHFQHVFVVNRSDVGWNGDEADSLACPPTPFTSDDGVGSVAHVTKCDGLHEADLADGVGKFLQRVVVELSSRLVGIRLNVVHPDFLEVRRAVCLDEFCLE